LRLQEIQKADDRSPKALKSSTRWLLAPYTVHDSALGCPLIPEDCEDWLENMGNNSDFSEDELFTLKVHMALYGTTETNIASWNPG